MTEIISFYSVAPSQGKRTLSQAFANVLATNDHRVLYIELDTKNPSIAASSQISHPYNNALKYFQTTVEKSNFNIEPFILKKDELLKTENRDMRKVFREMTGNLDYLVFPDNFNESNFPDLLIDSENLEAKAHEYIQQFVYALKTSKYDYVVLNLPNDIASIFGYEMISESDKVVNITTASANRLLENKRTVSFLSNNNQDLEKKWSIILNMTSPFVENEIYKGLINDTPFIIQYDPERATSELALETGSPLINEKLEYFALQIGISIIPTPINKRFKLFKGAKSK